MSAAAIHMQMDAIEISKSRNKAETNLAEVKGPWPADYILMTK